MEQYAGQQFVGTDLHRRRSVVAVRQRYIADSRARGDVTAPADTVVGRMFVDYPPLSEGLKDASGVPPSGRRDFLVDDDPEQPTDERWLGFSANSHSVPPKPSSGSTGVPLSHLWSTGRLNGA